MDLLTPCNTASTVASCSKVQRIVAAATGNGGTSVISKCICWQPDRACRGVHFQRWKLKGNITTFKGFNSGRVAIAVTHADRGYRDGTQEGLLRTAGHITIQSQQRSARRPRSPWLEFRKRIKTAWSQLTDLLPQHIQEIIAFKVSCFYSPLSTPMRGNLGYNNAAVSDLPVTEESLLRMRLVYHRSRFTRGEPQGLISKVGDSSKGI